MNGTRGVATALTLYMSSKNLVKVGKTAADVSKSLGEYIGELLSSSVNLPIPDHPRPGMESFASYHHITYSLTLCETDCLSRPIIAYYHCFHP